jgi:hypothetical protein
MDLSPREPVGWSLSRPRTACTPCAVPAARRLTAGHFAQWYISGLSAMIKARWCTTRRAAPEQRLKPVAGQLDADWFERLVSAARPPGRARPPGSGLNNRGARRRAARPTRVRAG